MSLLMLYPRVGAPVDIAPTADDPVLAADPSRNNNFSYNFPNDQTTQDRCPFAAHVRKTNPRGDLEDKFGALSTENRRMIRAGIAFGPEVTAAEAASEKTQQGRGLLFVSYQSDIVQSFQFVQKSKSSLSRLLKANLLTLPRLGKHRLFPS